MNSLGFNKKEKDTKVIVAMSGGVDSSVAAVKLKKEGYDVTGVTLRLYNQPNSSKSKSCCAGIDINDAKKIDLINFLAKAIGINGMVYGQSLDMECSNKEIDIKLLEKIQRKKTGELIHAACTMSYSISNFFEPSVQEKISKLAYLLGQLYQIIDDILDGTSTSENLGKTSGKDQKDNKATYVSILGVVESKKIKEGFYLEIKELVKKIPGNTQILNHLIDKIYARDY